MKKISTFVASALAIVALQAAPPAFAQPSPPGPVDSTLDIPANSSFFACEFNLRVQLHGKGAFRSLPGGRFLSISTSPGLRATLTNLDNNTSVTLNVTGTLKQELDAWGNVVTTANGRNLLGDPTTGLVLAIGNYTYTFDSSNTTLLKPLSGTGRLLPVCPMVQ